MSVALSRAEAFATMSAQNSILTVSGKTLIIADGGGGDWLLRRDYVCVAGQLVEGAMDVTVPSGYTGATYRLTLGFFNAADGALAYVDGPSAALVPTQSTTYAVPTTTAPPGTTRASVILSLVSAPATNRRLVFGAIWLISRATPDEIVAATLERDQRRDQAINASGGLVLTAAPVGPLAGQLTYLCSTWAAVAALDAIYRTGPVTLAATTTVLPASTHYAVGNVRYNTDRPVPGRDARWLVTVPIREAS